MKLYAISDLHVSHGSNRGVLASLPAHPDDWLAIAGDVGETPEELIWVLRILRDRFRQLVWVPGNHELWTLPNDPVHLRGELRYRYLVELCRGLGVLTPEDPYPILECDDGPFVIAPMLLLYDYSFRPAGLSAEQALARAARAGVVCADALFLRPDPYRDVAEWCHARVEWTAARLAEVPAHHPLVLISHFPLRRDLVDLPLIPEFTLWCGTERTEDWHRRFRAAVVVSGHLHRPGLQWRDGVRFEEVSLGYPQEWGRFGGPPQLRPVLPGAPRPSSVPREDRPWTESSTAKSR